MSILRILKALVFFQVSSFSVITNATDLGFRFTNGVCQNDKGQKGLNPYFIGQCGDLKGAVLGNLDFSTVDFSGSDFTGADLQNSNFSKTILVAVKFDSTKLSGVDFNLANISGSSFKSALIKNSTFTEATVKNSDFTQTDFRNSNLTYFGAEKCNFSKANLESVNISESNLAASNFSEAKISGANFDSANLEAAIFTKATGIQASFKKANLKNANLSEGNFSRAQFSDAIAIGTILTQAKLRGSQLQNTNLDSANLSKADLLVANFTKASVKGSVFKEALYSKRTLLPFTEDDAKKLGMIFKKSAGRVFILWDQKSAQLDGLVTYLSAQGIESVLAAKTEAEYEGKDNWADFDAVLHFNGTTYETGLTDAAQTQINEFVNKGGVFVYGEWNAYELSNNRQAKMKDLTLMTFSGAEGKLSIERIADKKDSPLLEDIPNSIDFEAGFSRAALNTFTGEQPQVFMKLNTGEPAVVTRKIGKGLVVAFSFTCTFNPNKYSCLNNADIRKLYLNAINLSQM